MMKSFKYRIFPTKPQERILNKTLEVCRNLYNEFVEERKTSWEVDKKNVSMYQQMNSLVDKKKINPELKTVYSQVLQQVAVRVDLAFQAFFRRVKSGETPGYPKFKEKRRYLSFRYPQHGCPWRIEEDKLRLSKIGNVYIKLHKPLDGIPKVVTIKKSSKNKWYAFIVCDIPDLNVKQPLNRIVGIDVGILKFATLSDGTSIDNPRFFEKDQKQLAKAHRKQNWKVVRTITERVANRRHNFIHQITNQLMERYDCFIVEDIDVNQMKEKHWCSKQISDASWGAFINTLEYKANIVGKKVIRVNPAYTSQDCSQCGHRNFKKLDERVHNCQCCGLTMDRDLNASKNILRLGLDILNHKA